MQRHCGGARHVASFGSRLGFCFWNALGGRGKFCGGFALLLLCTLSQLAAAQAPALNEYAAEAFYEQGRNTPEASTPEAVCSAWGARYGTNWTGQTTQVAPGAWQCQAQFNGAPYPGYVTSIYGQCQVSPIVSLGALSGRYVAHPYPVDPNASESWYRRAFDQGHPETLYTFALREFRDGKITEGAIALLRQAADKGFKQAEHVLREYMH
jgi:TPR repeat protein